jgi:hypothetical protein
LHPLTPQGGICNLLYTRKSPLGDLGVEDKKSTFSTAPGEEKKIRKRNLSSG